MATNLAIDDSLLSLARQVSGLKTKKDTVNTALKEFIQRRKQEEIINLFGKIDYDPAYDYKQLRKRS
ncbi:MAG: type II toxin-antitoxin system VapB family antitoxin [Pseudomonadota bacterium]